jgi:hypothetical protein
MYSDNQDSTAGPSAENPFETGPGAAPTNAGLGDKSQAGGQQNYSDTGGEQRLVHGNEELPPTPVNYVGVTPTMTEAQRKRAKNKRILKVSPPVHHCSTPDAHA